jgi:hypothetical protein
MPRILTVVALCLDLLPLALGPAHAQGPSTPEDRTIRQGDTIEWIAVSGTHKVRFGANGATSVAEINTILENFSQALTPGTTGDSPAASSGTLLTAKVKDDATPGKTFVFTCGIHTTPMLSELFTIAAKVPGQAPRNLRIKGTFVNNQMHWLLEATRDVQVDTN